MAPSPPCSTCSDPPRQELESAKVHSLITTGGRAWDTDILQDLFLEIDRKLIEEIPLGLREEDDSWWWYWHMDKKEEYSVKSIYKHLQIQRRGDRGRR